MDATSQRAQTCGRRARRWKGNHSVATGATSFTAAIAPADDAVIRVADDSRGGNLRLQLAQLERRKRELARPLERGEGDCEILDR